MQKRLVLTAEPGAGKSTVVPMHLLSESWLNEYKILMLEPRRVAAKSLAHFLSGQLGEKVGETVGYRVKNDIKVSANTRLEIVTEGILTRQLQKNPELEGIGLVIFDEFHERNLHSDLGLMLVKEVMSSLRDDLHCLVMSATIDSQSMSQYLMVDDGISETDTAPVLHCPGRAYPVNIEYKSKSREPLFQQVYSAAYPFLRLNRQSESKEKQADDILVFLPGQGEIRRCISHFEEKLKQPQASAQNHPQLLPLYGALPLEQQQLALLPDAQGRQKVIFATNIAETSLTIEGVSVVIDSGLERQMLFDAKSGMSRLEKVYISRASATQRSGRAGRLGPGQAVRLWAESLQLPEFQPEEIRTTDISQLLLNLAEWGQAGFDSVDWITPPPKVHFDACQSSLTILGLLDEQGKITGKGKRASQLPLPPRLAALWLSATTPEQAQLACELCALLSEKDLLNKYHTIDFSHRLQALWSPSDYRGVVNQATLQQVKQTAQRLKKSLPQQFENPTHLSHHEKLSLAPDLLLNGFPDLMAKNRQAGQNTFLLHNGRGAEISDEDPLCSEKWLVVLDINAQAKSGQIWLAAAIPDETVLGFVEPQLHTSESVFWDDKSGSAKARRVASYGALVIEESITTDLSREQKQRFLILRVKEQGLQALNWTKSCESWLARASWLSEQSDDFPAINANLLLDSLEDWLLPFMSDIEKLSELKKLDVYSLLISVLDWNQQQILESEAPTQFCAPSDKKVPIIYDQQQGPMISVQLQELFGLTASPKLAFGTVPLKFELLSPARRPIQTTSDLAGFWQTSYFEVAKEMRGRYPKHRWPENPMEEKAGRSIKAKKN